MQRAQLPVTTAFRRGCELEPFCVQQKFLCFLLSWCNFRVHLLTGESETLGIGKTHAWQHSRRRDGILVGVARNNYLPAPGMNLCHRPLHFSCALTPSNVCFPAKLNARIVNFLPGQSLVYRLSWYLREEQRKVSIGVPKVAKQND
jgi:hypothetical protein